MSSSSVLAASFRDPSGFLFTRDGILYRQVQPSYRSHYEQAESSGLVKTLVSQGLLISHREVSLSLGSPGAYKILQPEVVPFISYPYEWCFGQLKAAALLTLEIQKIALAHGMTLKDASAYNVQFRNGKPVFIDSLSFEIYKEGEPWIAYKQFCEHFLAPLALMSLKDLRLNGLFLSHPDGVPLDMASRLLPFCSWFSPALFLNLHLQARLQFQSGTKSTSNASMNKAALLRLRDHLENAIRGLCPKSQKTIWGNYQTRESYTEEGIVSKQTIVSEFLKQISFKRAWDLGASDGVYTALLSEKAEFVLALDGDPAATERHYQKISTAQKDILPLVIDLTHPSPALGWDNNERLPLRARGAADLMLMLAVVHHLAISKNIPLPRLASWAADLCHYLIIEFVPKEDAKVRELLSHRTDIFPNYSQEDFEKAFAAHFKIRAQKLIAGSSRVLYLLEKI